MRGMCGHYIFYLNNTGNEILFFCSNLHGMAHFYQKTNTKKILRQKTRVVQPARTVEFWITYSCINFSLKNKKEKDQKLKLVICHLLLYIVVSNNVNFPIYRYSYYNVKFSCQTFFDNSTQYNIGNRDEMRDVTILNDRYGTVLQ